MSYRRKARVLGLIAVVFNSLFALVASQAMPSGSVVVIVFGSLGLAVLGYVIAWVAEGVGGAMMIIGAIGLGSLVLGQPDGDPVSALVWAGPLGWAGYLFVRCWASEKTGSSDEPDEPDGTLVGRYGTRYDDSAEE